MKNYLWCIAVLLIVDLLSGATRITQDDWILNKKTYGWEKLISVAALIWTAIHLSRL